MASRRRTTLASVSNASLNSRSSAVPSRSSMVSTKVASTTVATKPSRFSISTAGGGGGGRSALGGQRPSTSGQRTSMGRQSLAPTERKSSTGVRRSTAYGNAAGNRSDPRPLMDKTYLNDSLHKMADYLSSHGYEQPINLKTLSRPSGRDFKNIMGFLFRQIDPSYVPSGRFEDDVIPFLKMIRYPFQLSKSSLAAVGAPQTWPKVMGAISWIVDLLLYQEEALAAEEEQKQRRREATQEEKDLEEEEGLTDESAANSEFLDYLGEAYSCFLEGDDDAYNALNAEFASTHEAARLRSGERTKELQEAMERLRNQIQEIKEGENELPKLEERRKSVLSDKEKYRSLFEQLQTHKQNLQSKIDARIEEDRRLKEALLPVDESNKAVREQISRQEFSAEDVERHLEERRRIRDAMLAATEAKEKARKRRWTAQEEVAKVKQSLRETAQVYESKAKALSLIPSAGSVAKNAGGVDYELKVREDMSENEEDVLTNDVKGVIRPKLSELKGVVMRNTQDFRQELSNLLVMEDKVEEEIADVETQLEVLRKQVKRKEETYKKEKYVLDQKVAEGKRGVEEEERRLSSLATPEDLDRLALEHDASMEQLRVDIQMFTERQDMELKHIECILQGALEMVLDYKEREEKCLAGLKHKCEHYLANVPDAQTPLETALNEGDDTSHVGRDSEYDIAA